MAQPTNSALPTGGVHRPTARLKIMTTPKCTGSMPMAGLVTTGSRIGVRMSAITVVSINMPHSSRNRITRSRVAMRFMISTSFF